MRLRTVKRVFSEKCSNVTSFPYTYIILYILLGYPDILGIRVEKRQINAHLRHF